MKYLYVFYYFIYLSFISSCNIRKSSNLFFIKGNIKGIKSSKVYFVEANQFESFLDSATYTNGTFLFRIPAKLYSKRMVNISYIDSNTHKIQTLQYINHVLSSKKQQYYYGGFILDDATTNVEVEGLANIREDSILGTHIKIRIDSIHISAGKETEALYATQMMQFGYLDANPNNRTNQFNTYISIIDKYPNSKYLLSLINENKSIILKNELELMLKHFSSTVIQEDAGKNLLSYATKKVDAPIFKNEILEDPEGNTKFTFNSSSKLNIIVFWASWCAPCRAEISDLKKIYNLYKHKNINITSVSIDEDKNKWLLALKQENMDWLQLIVPDTKKQTISSKFELGSIPYILFLDNNGKLIYRSIGVEKNSFDKFKELINNYLKE